MMALPMYLLFVFSIAAVAVAAATATAIFSRIVNVVFVIVELYPFYCLQWKVFYGPDMVT